MRWCHEQRLVLGTQVRFRLLDQQERDLIGMRLKQQQLGRHEQQVVVAQSALHALGACLSPTCAVGGSVCVFSTERCEGDQGVGRRGRVESACSADHPHFLLIGVGF
jgi:hypothetical protein